MRRANLLHNSSLSVVPMVQHKHHSSDIIDTHHELIKIIRRYEYAHGWTLLIAPEKMPDRRIMNSCSVNLDKVLTIRKKYCRSAYQLAKQAISFENCSVLVIWDTAINGIELADIRERAHANGIALYLLNHENSEYYANLTLTN